jgi:hypothetical protein
VKKIRAERKPDAPAPKARPKPGPGKRNPTRTERTSPAKPPDAPRGAFLQAERNQLMKLGYEREGNTGSIEAADRDKQLSWLREQLDGPLAWLRDEHGFALTEARWPTLRLDSDRVRLDLSIADAHGATKRLSATVGEHGHPEFYSVEGAHRLLTGEELDARATLVDDRERALGALVARLRGTEPLVAGDPEAFATLRRRDKEAITGTQLDEDLRVARPKAKAAFQARDYPRVIALLDPLEGHLDAHEQGWLDYARRKSGA